MPFVTHFMSPEGEKLPIAASELAVVEIPAAGSADLGGWSVVATPGKYTRCLDLAAPADSAILPSNQSLITYHGLTITHDAQGEQWVLQLDSLPAQACTLTLIFIHCENGGEPLVLPALGSGGGGDTSALQEQINELRAEMETEDLCTTLASLSASVTINEVRVIILLYASRITKRGTYNINSVPSFLRFLTQKTVARASNLSMLVFVGDDPVYHAIAPNMYRDSNGGHHVQFLFQLPGETELKYYDVSLPYECVYSVEQKDIFAPGDEEL